jgi:hypothetical protein
LPHLALDEVARDRRGGDRGRKLVSTLGRELRAPPPGHPMQKFAASLKPGLGLRPGQCR